MTASPSTSARHFSRIVIIDWSAAASRGPARPSPDRCWLAHGTAEARFSPQYFRTRDDCVARVRDLLAGTEGNVLVGWDFPFGTPAGSRIGGGRPLANHLNDRIEDPAGGPNNRFAVAEQINRDLGSPPGPFWFCPPAHATAALSVTKPGFAHRPFREMRLVEQRLRAQGRKPMSVWQLGGSGAVGSQTLLGLPRVLDLVRDPALTARSCIWPFETGWDRALAGVVHAEVWPSLADRTAYDHPIKDANQVAALCDEYLALDARGELLAALARPPRLTEAESAACLREEGWVVGVR